MSGTAALRSEGRITLKINHTIFLPFLPIFFWLILPSCSRDSHVNERCLWKVPLLSSLKQEVRKDKGK